MTILIILIIISFHREYSNVVLHVKFSLVIESSHIFVEYAFFNDHTLWFKYIWNESFQSWLPSFIPVLMHQLSHHPRNVFFKAKHCGTCKGCIIVCFIKCLSLFIKQTLSGHSLQWLPGGLFRVTRVSFNIYIYIEISFKMVILYQAREG